MKAEEKAKEIHSIFVNSLINSNGTASGANDCAIIAVDEILMDLVVPFNSDNSFTANSLRERRI